MRSARVSLWMIATAALAAAACDERGADPSADPHADAGLGRTDAAAVDPRCPPSPYTGHACGATDLGAQCLGTVSCACDTETFRSFMTPCECREGALGRVYHCEDDCAVLCMDVETPVSCTIDVNASGVAVGLIGEGCYPRCAASTRTALVACTSYQCAEQVVTDDPTPAVMAGDQAVDCDSCLEMGRYACEFEACPTESAALAECRADDPFYCFGLEQDLYDCMLSISDLPPACESEICYDGAS